MAKYHLLGRTYDEIYNELRPNPPSMGSISAIVTRFDQTGDVETHQGVNPLGPHNFVMTNDRVERLLNSMADNAEAGDGDDMLLEIYTQFLSRENVVVDISTICRTLKRYGMTRKRAARLGPRPRAHL